MTGSDGKRRRKGNQTSLRSSTGLPVFCEIYCEPGPDGFPVIFRSIEIVGGTGNRVLSQAPIDEAEVLLIYQRWRTLNENQDKIIRVEFNRNEYEHTHR